MFTVLIRARMSQVGKVREGLPLAKKQVGKSREQFPLAKNYAFYDQLIKEFNESNGKLKVKTMEAFLSHSLPKISRRPFYEPILTKIFKASVPHFVENFDFYKNKFLFSNILNTYQNLNLHREEIFDLAEKSLNPDDSRSKNFLYYYFPIVDLHHMGNPQLKRIVKQHLLKHITRQKFVQGKIQKNWSFSFIFAIKALNLMMMDQEVNLQQCQAVINSIEKNIFPYVKNISLIESEIAKNLALAKELIYFHKLKINSYKFYQLLDSGLIYMIDQKMQLSKPLTRKYNFDIDLQEGKQISMKGSKITQNSNQINHGLSSIFETIFSRYLQEFGYDYQKNAVIGMYEYDLLIKGRKSKKYHPFQHMNQPSQLTTISPQKWQTFKSMSNLDQIKISQKWQQAVILNLNGPYHYIDSDVYGNARVTRTDEVKMMLLRNYGYNRFNQVHYGEWEQVHEKGVMIEEFIRELIGMNVVLGSERKLISDKTVM